ncbi:MAG: RloB family protein [Tissierellia bacterium]|nr:RloB family protein [Tissierellia bacterium]
MNHRDRRKAERKKREPRKGHTREPKANSFLIVTEGTKTEPYYFQGLAEKIEKTRGGNIHIHGVEPIVDIEGEGRATQKLVDRTSEILHRAKIFYQQVWVVFDKDDFHDFDEAVEEAEKRGFHAAWSNECFEYWLYLHFRYSQRAQTRYAWYRLLHEEFRKQKLGKGLYKKNYDRLFDMVAKDGGLDRAIQNAKERMKAYKKGVSWPSGFNPGTTVHLLVEELRKYIKED